jgi:hypothetical protein
MATATVKLSSPATGLLAGGRTRRSAPSRRGTVIRAAAGSYSDELVSTAVSAPAEPYIFFFPQNCCPSVGSRLTAGGSGFGVVARVVCGDL